MNIFSSKPGPRLSDPPKPHRVMLIEKHGVDGEIPEISPIAHHFISISAVIISLCPCTVVSPQLITLELC